MPIVNVKLSPPVYNSDRDVPPYAEWYEKFLQFVAYNHGGDAIIALINCALGREDTIYIHETSAIPDALRLGQAEVEQMLALTAGGGRARRRILRGFGPIVLDESKKQCIEDAKELCKRMEQL